MIQVNVREKKILDLIWRNGEWFPVPVQIVSFLIEATVHEESQSVGIKEVG